MKNYSNNPKSCLTQIVVILIFTAFFIYKLYKHSIDADKFIENQKKIELIENQKVLIFKKKYDFNVDNKFNFHLSDFNKFKSEKIKTPIIVYYLENESMNFNYKLNSIFSKKPKDFILDSIKTIVVVTKDYNTVGDYYYYNSSKKKPVALQEELTIFFIETKNKNIIKKINKKGGLPPKEIEFKKNNPPEIIYGEKISDHEIIEYISDAIY